ncbi:MAG: hypothetical protein ACK58T_01465, partial [Phycisphaerae bacterium]
MVAGATLAIAPLNTIDAPVCRNTSGVSTSDPIIALASATTRAANIGRRAVNAAVRRVARSRIDSG